MFKRYKNPLEKEVSNTSFESKQGGGSVGTQTIRHQTSQNEGSRLPSSYQSIVTEAPPRFFDDNKVLHPSPYSSSSYRTAQRMQEPREQSLNEKRPPKVLEEEIKTTPSLHDEEPDTTLGEGVVFKGELTFKRLLRIDGQFEGDLVSDGKLFVGPSGVVKSNVKMQEAIIEGKVEGNIFVEHRLELRSQAKIYGDIEANILSVDEGVTIVGNVSVTPNKSNHID